MATHSSVLAWKIPWTEEAILILRIQQDLNCFNIDCTVQLLVCLQLHKK